MASPVANERVPALAPLHTDIESLRIHPQQPHANFYAFDVHTKLSQREFHFNYRIIQPLDRWIVMHIIHRLKVTTTPVGDLLGVANEVSTILQAYQSLQGLGARNTVRLADARAEVDQAIRSLQYAGQIPFPALLFDDSQRELKYAAIYQAKDAIFRAVPLIDVSVSEGTAVRLGIPAKEYQKNLVGLYRALNFFNIWRLACSRQLLA